MATVMQLNHLRAFLPYSRRKRGGPAISSQNAPLVKFAYPKCRAEGNQSQSETQPQQQQQQQQQQQEEKTDKNAERKESRGRMQADSTDWIASSLTRRFGFGAGFAWFAFLAFGVISEQIKTRLEVSQEQQNIRDVENTQEVILPNGIKYVDLRVGGGSSPKTGDLVVIGLQGKVKSTGNVFVDTFSGRKSSLAFLFGIRPYTKGICEGLEYVMTTMKTGGKRKAVIPPELGFGKTGADLDGDILIPPEATLEYVVELQKVSIPPS